MSVSDNYNILYHIDDQDQIVLVSETWDAFALANEGHNILSSHVFRRSIWDFISDPATEQIYRQVLKTIRSGRSLRFNFRCDSPARRRLLEMNIVSGQRSTVIFNTRTLSEEMRHPPAILGPRKPSSDKFVRMCGWCKKIDMGNQWVEVEVAMEQLRLFEEEKVPSITHGICGECYGKMKLLIES